MSRELTYTKIGDLKADPRNPKAHAVEVIDASVGRFGYVEPVVVDGRTGYIISGHGRTETLRRMQERGEDAPEGVTVDEGGEWLIPVVAGWSSRTDSEAAAALIALNRTGELGGWVDDSLLELLDDLAQQDDGLAGVGYTDKDHEALTALLARVDPEDTERDLDSLAEEFGAPTEDDTLRRVVLRLPPDLAAQAEEALEAGASHASVVREWLGL